MKARESLPGADGIGAFEDQLDLGVALQQIGDDASRQRFVVSKQHPKTRHGVAAAAIRTGGENGNAISTMVPAASPARTSKLAVDPYSWASRDLVLLRPVPASRSRSKPLGSPTPSSVTQMRSRSASADAPMCT